MVNKTKQTHNATYYFQYNFNISFVLCFIYWATRRLIKNESLV